MNVVSIIEKKKKNIELTTEEINYVIEGYMSGAVEDYQISALLMAIYFNGMTEKETIDLTKAMINSGDVISFDNIGKPIVDKHSTGGVGDKTSIVLGPILATFDLAVAKMSGRGLGHTGGTVDKFESIEGMQVELDEKTFMKQVEKIGIAITGQSKELVPADKKLYALRDVTGTVDSMPLIASSIMSKKIASGSHYIILDVKYGSGAFMKTKEEAEKLANELVMIGNSVGRVTKAAISNMEQPLGNAVGNVVEVQEAIDTLKGHGPKDLTELCIELSAELLVMAKKFSTVEDAQKAIITKIETGEVYEKFIEFITEQGAIVGAVDKMAKAKAIIDVKAPVSGYISKLDAVTIGKAAMYLGAGRVKKSDSIDYSVGVVLNYKIGDLVNEGDLLYQIYSNKDDNRSIIEMCNSAYEFSDSKCEEIKTIDKFIG